MSDVAKTPREELECKKKYLYEYSMFWECNDGSKCQILEEDVVRLLNEQQSSIMFWKQQAEQYSNECNVLQSKNEQLKNELGKEKSLREYSDSMYDADLIVNIRFSNGEWKADVSVIDV